MCPHLAQRALGSLGETCSRRVMGIASAAGVWVPTCAQVTHTLPSCSQACTSPSTSSSIH